MPLSDWFDNNNGDNYFNIENVNQILFRHKRSSNNTSSSNGDNRSAIEKFYDDPNNKAMYLVFPLFVLVIGTCCGLYFCDRCRKHFKKKKAEERKKEVSEMTENEPNQSFNREDSPSSTSELDKRADSSINREETAMTETSNRNDTPLEDVENCPEVRAVNAVPIKYRETSFISDVQSVNKNNVQTPPGSAKGLKPKVETEQISTQSTDNKEMKTNIPTAEELYTDKKDDENNRPPSKTSLKSLKTLKKPVASAPDPIPSVNNQNDKIVETIVNREDTKMEIEKQIQNNYENIKAKRRDSYRSTSTVRSNKRSISPDSKYSGSIAYHEKTTPLPDVTNSQKYPKIDRKFSHLSPQAIGEILQYYKDKKHMPDIIPDEDENIAPIKRKFRRARYKIING